VQRVQLRRREPTGRSEHRPVDAFAQDRLGRLLERRKSVVTSAGVSTRSAGIGSERGVVTWDAAGVFDFVVSAEVGGGRREWGRRGLQYFVGGRVGELWMLDDRHRGRRAVFWDLRIFPVLVRFRFRTSPNPEPDRKNRSGRFRFGFGDFPELNRWSGSRFGEMCP
jgi:hypothetical protein